MGFKVKRVIEGTTTGRTSAAVCAQNNPPRTRRRVEVFPPNPPSCVATCAIDLTVTDASYMYSRAKRSLEEIGLSDEDIQKQLVVTDEDGDTAIDIGGCLKVLLAGTIALLNDLSGCPTLASEVYVEPLLDPLT